MGYLILKHFFLKPGLVVVKAIDEMDQGLKRDLALIQEEVRRQEGVSGDQWERHCRVLYSRVPVQKPLVPQGVVYAFTPVEPLSTEGSQRFAEEVKQAVISSVVRES